MVSQKKLKQEWQNAGITNDLIFGNVIPGMKGVEYCAA